MPSDKPDAIPALDLVRHTVAREIEPQALPGDDDDLTAAGLVDSMTRVNILLAIEETAGAPAFAAEWPDDRPFSVREIAERLRQARPLAPSEVAWADPFATPIRQVSEVSIKGWAASAGSLVIPAEQVDAECGFAPGFLRDRTGIETVRRASGDANETSLAAKAAESALAMAGIQPSDVDLLVGVSTTHLGLPSFAPSVHSRLLLRESAGAIDVGGACCGVLHALATASSLLSTVNERTALVIASEVNSRRLATMDAPPEFRALFGDAACAFVLERSASGEGVPGRRLREFIWGASATYASALSVSSADAGQLRVEFRGEQLAAAAIETLQRILDRLAAISGIALAEAEYFALHEPNPRVVGMLARKAGIQVERMPRTSQTWGNLGSATCGVNLCKALTGRARIDGNAHRPSIFAAAVGPGLLWAGAYIG